MPHPFVLDRNSAQAFMEELTSIRKKVSGSFSVSDFHHLLKIQRWGRTFTVLGYMTAWTAPNPISPCFIGIGTFIRWIVMHHVGHQAYDRVPEVPHSYTSKGFAKGWRRYIDWLDWMMPEAWSYEHNVLHHYNTGDKRDPDLAEDNLKYLRDSNLPMVFRYLIVFFFACTWKFLYYVPSTVFYMKNYQDKSKKEVTVSAYVQMFSPFSSGGHMLWLKCLIPYITLRFCFIPLMFLPLGKGAALSVLINSILAEVVTNIYGFLMIVPNHTGEDLYRFDSFSNSKDESAIRQIVGTVNYTTGSDRIDFLHGWLNYQIEHHLWPELPLSKYQGFQIEVKLLCKKYGIPYIQENVFKRLLRTLDILVGKASMRRSDFIIQNQR